MTTLSTLLRPMHGAKKLRDVMPWEAALCLLGIGPSDDAAAKDRYAQFKSRLAAKKHESAVLSPGDGATVE
jgi:hypothetical protein